MGSDFSFVLIPFISFHFNPHSPCGERLAMVLHLVITKNDFNPHSPCGERHIKESPLIVEIFDFNPHSPCGERHNSIKSINRNKKFQSTLPVWGATSTIICTINYIFISIHTPRVGSDNVSGWLKE